MLTLQSFRAIYPEFNDTSKYPDAVITYYLNIAFLKLNQERWAELYDYGTGLLVAHYLTIKALNLKAASIGGNIGQNLGALTAKSVGYVSMSYDTSRILDPFDGQWNLSSYGLQFIQEAKAIGSGPTVL